MKFIFLFKRYEYSIGSQGSHHTLLFVRHVHFAIRFPQTVEVLLYLFKYYLKGKRPPILEQIDKKSSKGIIKQFLISQRCKVISHKPSSLIFLVLLSLLLPFVKGQKSALYSILILF